MKLQAGSALNHKGIFIEGLGVQYHQHKIIVNVNAHDVLAGDDCTYNPSLKHLSLQVGTPLD